VGMSWYLIDLQLSSGNAATWSISLVWMRERHENAYGVSAPRVVWRQFWEYSRYAALVDEFRRLMSLASMS
jgi:hypothetical protein